jgi:outer membrane protein assembly factor BamB
VGAGLASGRPPGGAPAEVPRPPLRDALLVRRTPADALGAVVARWGDVWANDPSNGTLLRLGGDDGRVRARIPVGGRAALAADHSSVWALRWGGRFRRVPNGPLLRIDPVTNRVTQRIPLRPPSREPMQAFGVLACEGSVWVWGPRRVLRYDETSGRLVRELAIGDDHGEVTGAALDRAELVAVTADGQIVRFTLGGAVAGPRRLELAGAELLGVRGRRVLASVNGTLVAADDGSGRILWRRPLGFRVATVVPWEGVLLAQGSALGDPGDRLWALDPDTGRVLGAAVVPSFGTTAMAANRGALWIATAGGEMIVVPPPLARLPPR